VPRTMNWITITTTKKGDFVERESTPAFERDHPVSKNQTLPRK
jgi:hypothetical protein